MKIVKFGEISIKQRPDGELHTNLDGFVMQGIEDINDVKTKHIMVEAILLDVLQRLMVDLKNEY